jgi:hypothetical protein
VLDDRGPWSPKVFQEWLISLNDEIDPFLDTVPPVYQMDLPKRVAEAKVA